MLCISTGEGLLQLLCVWCGFNRLNRGNTSKLSRSSTAQRLPQGLPVVKVSLQVHEDILLLDYNTVQTLELIENAKTGQQRGGSLFACINQTKTAMGSRLMRSSLLQPLKNPSIINARLDAVDQIVASSDLYSGLGQALDSFPDLERVCSNLLIKSALELQFSSIGPINPTTILLLLHLNTALIKVSAIVRVLEDHCAESTLLKSILTALKVSPTEDPVLFDNTQQRAVDDASDSCEIDRQSRSLSADEMQYISSDRANFGSQCDMHTSETSLQRIQSAISTKLTSGENNRSRAAEQLRMQAVNLIKPGVDGMMHASSSVSWMRYG